MRNIFENWLEGLELLVMDDLISYYTYFTMVLAEVAYLWGSFPKLALPFTCILIASILNIVICSFFKGSYECTKHEITCARVYAINFIAIFIVGFLVNPIANLVLFAIPLITTALWIQLRTFQDTSFLGSHSQIIKFISILFSNHIFWWFSQVVVIGLPFGVLAVGLFSTPIVIWLKILILAIYFILAPFISLFEDYFATCNIFELAYDITWHGEDN